MPCRGMALVFYSCSELKSLFLSLGCELNILQLTSGPIQGSLCVSNTSDVQIFQIRTNQGLLFQGEAIQTRMNVAIEASNNLNLHRVQGLKLPPKSLSGFNPTKTDTYFSISPNSCLLIADLPKINVLEMMSRVYGEEGLELISSNHHGQITSERFASILSSMSSGLFSTHRYHSLSFQGAHDYTLSILDALFSQKNRNDEKKNGVSSINLVREFVSFAFKEGISRPLTIDDLKKNLFTSKTILSASVKNTTGLTPLTFLRNVRLEQVRSALLRGDSSTSIADIASHYGFPNRGHFSRYYADLFGELPRHTLRRADSNKLG